MIINVTTTDIWKEFVYWRKTGHDHWAFAYIRRNPDINMWRTLIAGLVKFNYPNVQPGDIVMTPTEQFRWEADWDELFQL